MALADAGEAALVYCDCGYAADTEAATVKVHVEEGAAGELEKVATPEVSTIEDVAEFCTFMRVQRVRRWHLSTGTVVRWCALARHS